MTTTLTLFPPPPSEPHHGPRPPPEEYGEPHISHISGAGKDALWIAFAIFVASNLIIALLTARYDRKHRIFHYITMLIVGTAALNYFAMATNTGYTFVNIGKQFIGGKDRIVLRQVFWSRYVDWAITTPLIILNLCLLSGAPLIDTVALMVADFTMVFSGFVAALTPGNHASRWVWYFFGVVLLVYILARLFWDCAKPAKQQSSQASSLFISLYLLTVIVWLLYPLFFALGEITATIGCNMEMIAYTILDLLAKVVFGMWLLFGHKYTAQHSSVLPEWIVDARGAKQGQISLSGEETAGRAPVAQATPPAPADPAPHA